MTVKGGTVPACAACKYQRRRCSAACPLAPYFPANQSKIFLNVHRLFGVSNVTKTLEKVKPDHREDAMRSIIFEAEMRERFPVDGCCAVITHLRDQIYLATQELEYVKAKLEGCRNQIIITNKGCSELPLVQFFFNENDGSLLNENGSHLWENQIKPMLDPCPDTTMNSLISIQSEMNAFCVQDRNNINFDAHRFDNIVYDERQSYVESKFETRVAASSPGSSLEDPAQDGCRREMRGGAVAAAAEGFSFL